MAELINQTTTILDPISENGGGISAGNKMSVASSDTASVGKGFFQKLEESGWLKHIRLIIKASILGIYNLKELNNFYFYYLLTIHSLICTFWF